MSVSQATVLSCVILEAKMLPETDHENRLLTTFRRLQPWLMGLWITFVLSAFFIIRILGSSTGQRLLNMARLRLNR